MPPDLQPIWDLRSVSKAYPGVQANDRVSLALMPGRIHALLGENGCGKSTLIRMLSGVERPDSGEMLHRGQPVTLDSPSAARARGVATVFQEFSVVPTLTVAENVYLGRWPRRAFGLVDWDAMRRGASAVLAQLDLHLDPDAILSTLSVAEQQLVEIAKSVAADASLFILDEPTTALGLDEIDRLHVLLRRLRDQGAAILYVSHRLDEVTALVDEVTVLRGGKVVARPGDTEVRVDAIVTAMIGGAVKDHYPKVRNATGQPLLQVQGLRTAASPHPLTFTLHKGEVLGLGGVLGSGRTEIARALFGLDPALGGSMTLDGRQLRLGGPADAIAAGIGMVTENRKTDGLFFNFDGRANISSASLPRLSRFGFLGLRQEAEEARALGKRVEVSAGATDKSVRHLSGGNQQKVVIARWLAAGVRVLILDEPTQGIDIGARLAVYRLMNDLTAAGCGIILISSDHEELLSLADRVALVRQGRIDSIADPSKLTADDLVRASTTPVEVPA